MKILRGTTIVETGCLKSDSNSFYSKTSDGRLFVMRQPNLKKYTKQRDAWKLISDENKKRYKRVNVEERWLYNMKQRCKQPLYRGEVPGVLPLSVEVDGEVVGFSDGFFRYGTAFERYGVPSDDLCSNFSILALDKFHGRGIGTYFAYTSSYIGRHFGCKWIVGATFENGGMYNIRKREGWSVVSIDNGIVAHKMRL